MKLDLEKISTNLNTLFGEIEKCYPLSENDITDFGMCNLTTTDFVTSLSTNLPKETNPCSEIEYRSFYADDINMDDMTMSKMFCVSPYSESDSVRIIEKLNLLLSISTDVHNSNFILLCIQEVSSGSGLTSLCIDYLNNIYTQYNV